MKECREEAENGNGRKRRVKKGRGREEMEEG